MHGGRLAVGLGVDYCSLVHAEIFSGQLPRNDNGGRQGVPLDDTATAHAACALLDSITPLHSTGDRGDSKRRVVPSIRIVQNIVYLVGY